MEMNTIIDRHIFDNCLALRRMGVQHISASDGMLGGAVRY